MSGRYPKLINPLRFVEKRGSINAEIRVNSLKRLHESLIDDSGSAEFELNFYKKDKLATIDGAIKANLVLQCQTCLETLLWPVHSQFKLALVTSIDEANLLPDDYEPLMVSDDLVAVDDIIEDELILALPTVPRHQDCHYQPADFQPADSGEDKLEKPFSILSQLK